MYREHAGGWRVAVGPWADVHIAGYRVPNPSRHPEDQAEWEGPPTPSEGLRRAVAEYDRLRREEGLLSVAMLGVRGVREFGDWAKGARA
jgi:hypothetical protein